MAANQSSPDQGDRPAGSHGHGGAAPRDDSAAPKPTEPSRAHREAQEPQAPRSEDRDRGVEVHPAQAAAAPAAPEDERSRTTVIHEPAKILRIGEMIKRLLEEVRSAPLDEAARARLAEVHERSITELEDGLSPDLVAELHRITLPFTDDAVPSEAELRIAQAQLVGWLEGLFHGLQTAMVAQQMAAQAQLQQMQAGQRVLPPGLAGEAPRTAGSPGPDSRPTPGQYL